MKEPKALVRFFSSSTSSGRSLRLRRVNLHDFHLRGIELANPCRFRNVLVEMRGEVSEPQPVLRKPHPGPEHGFLLAGAHELGIGKLVLRHRVPTYRPREYARH